MGQRWRQNTWNSFGICLLLRRTSIPSINISISEWKRLRRSGKRLMIFIHWSRWCKFGIVEIWEKFKRLGKTIWEMRDLWIKRFGTIQNGVRMANLINPFKNIKILLLKFLAPDLHNTQTFHPHTFPHLD